MNRLTDEIPLLVPPPNFALSPSTASFDALSRSQRNISDISATQTTRSRCRPSYEGRIASRNQVTFKKNRVGQQSPISI